MSIMMENTPLLTKNRPVLFPSLVQTARAGWNSGNCVFVSKIRAPDDVALFHYSNKFFLK